jgi:hypothetical protein
MSKAEGVYLEGCSVDDNKYSNSVDMTLSPFFTAKRLHFDADLHHLTLVRLTKKEAEIFLKITKPNNVKLFIWNASKLTQMYNCKFQATIKVNILLCLVSEIVYNDELTNASAETIETAQKISNVVTNLLCFPTVLKYKNCKYENLKRVIIPSTFTVTPDFLQRKFYF